MFEDVRGVLQPSLQCGHDERGHVAAVTHGEGALQLQRADECQQKDLVIHQLSKLLQGFLHARLSAPRHLHTETHMLIDNTQSGMRKIHSVQHEEEDEIYT